jgi:hypothetical protein
MVRKAGTIPTTTVESIAYRYSNYDTPFWARSNTRPGRWHLVDDGPTQYLSLSTNGSWADLLRTEDLRTEAEAAMVQMPLWQARIDQSYVVDYSDFGAAESAGFPPSALVDDDQARCRVEGRRLRALGYSGVLAPSAALPGEISLTLFGPKVSIGWNSSTNLASAIPASVLTRGAPPPGLTQSVRFVGQVHDGYAVYERSRTPRT